MNYKITLGGSGTKEEIISSLLTICQDLLVPGNEKWTFEDKTLCGEYEQMEDHGMAIGDFMDNFGHMLVKVNNDDNETGDYRLLESEKDIASNFETMGHKIYSIMEHPILDEEIVEAGINTSCYCVGYFVMEKEDESNKL